MGEMARILRVFPRRTSCTPDDAFVAIGEPGLFRPEANEVHVSATFTWDISRARHLRDAWAEFYPVAKLGGPAIDGEPSGEFIPGRYLKRGITITTRGCPKSCPWCLVQAPFEELTPIAPGWIVQDNNLLAASRKHFLRVLNMLKVQNHSPKFRGGLDAELLTDWHAERLRSLPLISEVWLACDTDAALPILKRAVDKLRWLPRRKLRCYVMLGWNRESVEQARRRLENVWDIGCLPFAQLYEPAIPRTLRSSTPDRHGKQYNRDWRLLEREWARPAAMFGNHKGYADFEG